MSCLSCKYSGSPRLGERRIILGVKLEPLNQNTKIADADLEHLKIELKKFTRQESARKRCTLINLVQTTHFSFFY